MSRANSASAAAAHAVSTSSSGSSSSPIQPASPSPSPSVRGCAAGPMRGTTTNVRRPAAASARTRSHVPSRSSGRRMPGPDRDPALGRGAQRGHVEVRVQDLAQRPRDRRRGHQQDVRRAPSSPSPRARRAARRRTGAARRPRRARGRRTRPPPGAARGSRRRPAPGRWRAPRTRSCVPPPPSEPVSRITAIPRSSSSAADASRCWRARRSVGASSAACRPSSAAAASAQAATAVLPEPTSPWTRRSIGTARARSSRISSRVRAWSAVSATAWPSLREMARLEGRRGSGRRPPRDDRDRRRVRAAARPPPPDHAQLEREQLVEGEPAQRGVARLERRRVVGVLERLGDRRAAPRRRGSSSGRYSG